MAKRKDDAAEDVAEVQTIGAAEDAAESAEVLPMQDQAPKQRWKVASKPGLGGPEMVVEADTVEDAIRTYNGQSTAFSRKQLVIEAI